MSLGEPALSSLPAEIGALAAIAKARSSVLDYFVPLLSDGDEIVRVAAALAMMERNALRWTEFDTVLALARHGAVRTAAFQYFQSIWEHELAAKALETEVEPETVAEDELMEARLRADDAGCAHAWHRLYLALGNPQALLREYEYLYKAGGAQLAFPLAVRNLVINPHDPQNAYRLLHDCIDMRRTDLIGEIGKLLAAADLHPRIFAVFSAWASLVDGRASEAQQRLKQAANTRPAPASISQQLLGTAQRLNADILDALGDYRAAYSGYLELAKTGRADLPDVASLKRRMTSVAGIRVPTLPREDRHNWVTMTGFPRSGTTLLEIALGRHPAIETFEELPTRAAMQLYLDRELPRAEKGADTVPIFLEARRRYFDEMERRRRKPGASVFIDKSPLRSADAGFMVRAFPDQRYIFSIRHPYDVVLSCFKQAFAPNMSMEIFRTFENAVGFYDFTMSQWFAAYRMNDPSIHYLRYDDLVTDFEVRMKSVLGFLGLHWDPVVLDFAEAAKTRASATPSYQKVRQGLSIGVQSSWRNYGFLFQSDAARPLRKWVDRFGYSAV